MRLGCDIVTAWVIFSAVFAPSAPAYTFDPDDFAAQVIDYTSGTGVTFDFLTGTPYTDAATALGRPTVDTTGDTNSGPPTDMMPVVPVYPAFRAFEIVTVGNGGRLTLKFNRRVYDDPRNPFGFDMTLFGNASGLLGGGGFWENGDPNDATIATAPGGEPAIVSVSQDGVTWYSFDTGPFADTFAPTLGRVYDTDDPEPSLPGNQWWGAPTDPTLPLDPSIAPADLVGMTVADAAQRYGRSAGGTSFDLSTLPLTADPQTGWKWVEYVRITDDPSSSVTAEIDAVADVAPTPLCCDFNFDGAINLADYDILSGNYGTPAGATYTMGDATGDGAVSFEDFVQLALNFQHSAAEPPPDPLPQPATAPLLLIALLVMCRRRDRAAPRHPRNAGFTLIELLVVLAIVALLVAIVLPALGAGRERARAVQCLGNERQMALAADAYAQTYDDSYPIPRYYDFATSTSYVWDITVKGFGPSRRFEAGPLWQGGGDLRIQQCPSFTGADNFGGDPHTGYNYNVSYIGRYETLDPDTGGLYPPARRAEVRTPVQTVLFGDGEYADGANKFMRAPFKTIYDAVSAAAAGAQGFRHHDTTNAAFADGHAESLAARYTNTDSSAPVADGTGFLSADNSLYDLE